MANLNLPDPAAKPRIVVVGGGFAGLNFVNRIDSHRYQVVLLDRHNYHTFAPLLYQVATAGLEAPDICGPLRKTFRGKPDFHFRMLQVHDVDPVARRVHTGAGPIDYDHLVLATGTRANFFGNTNIATHAFPLKTVPDARRLRNQIFQTLERADLTDDPAERQRLMTFLIVGGGPSGVEVAGALSELRRHVLTHDYPDTPMDQLRFVLVEGEEELLSTFSDRSSREAYRNLEEMDVELRFQTLMTDYDGRTATFRDGSTLECSTVIWGAGVTGEIIEGLSGESLERARYRIDNHLRVAGYENVYALGDVALLTNDEWPRGHPGVAQVAIQMGRRLAENLNNIARGRPTKAFRYVDKGNLAIIGRNRAVADLPRNLHFSGVPAWFVWAFVHIFYLIGFRNRLFTFLSWVGNYLTYNRAVRLVLEPTLDEELREEGVDAGNRPGLRGPATGR
ncbi:NADH dehydrogenase [Lewinella marina]|uniref:NADH:ubiquinone reductase (non-electrogenic) n=1 Tax=Neolewinella marina TaxID=438751 RepID=A0A2G0CK92_9BACT|nr:NAD(P)/FAD-dependent oxidoreductase [Neolewinella marina]NJB84415.1 NADH dehydrogenase [Neolewinella marina]PHL00393.1 FAD-dependent oxidoreductase [Neolewinella marina]